MTQENGYHISTRTGLAGKCDATVRKCQFKDATHYSSLEEAKAEANRIQAQKAVDKALHTNRKPIRVEVEETPLPLPQVIGEIDLTYADNSFYVTVLETEHDYDTCSAVVGAEYAEPCRDVRITDSKFSSPGSVNIDNVLQRLTYRNSPVTPRLREIAEELGLDHTDAYYIKVEGGYYGDETEVHLLPEKAEALYREYCKEEGARDPDGVLDYVRSKGYATAGLTPIEAIRHQLNAENLGRKHPLVEKAAHVHVMSVRLNQVKVPNQKYYEKIAARKIQSGTNGKEIAGVLVLKGREYHLVDGYHRHKEASKQNENTKFNYIILSETDYIPRVR